MKKSRKDQIKGNLQGGKKQGQPKGKHPGNTSLTAPLTTPQARHMAGAQARSEYAPTINAIKGDREGSKQREKEEGQWFGALGEQANQAAAATDASYGQADAALLAHMQAAQAAAQATQGQIAQGNTQTAQLTGADPSLFAPIQAEGQAAAQQRDLTSAALAAPIAQAGAAEAGYLRGAGLNAQREGISQRLKERSRRDKIKEDLTSARKERAQKVAGNFYDIRGDERDYGIQQAAFKLNKGEAAADAAQAAASQGLDEAQFGETKRHNRATEANAAADNAPGGMTPTQRRAQKDARQSASAAAYRTIQANGVPKTPQEWAGLEAIVAQEDGVSAAVAREIVATVKQKTSRGVAPAAVKNAKPHFP
jgi:hypothetical protein